MIENIKILPDSLHVKFKNKLDDNFPNIWLRDHAKDDENWDQRSHQRKTHTANLDPKLFIKEASVSELGDYINILWSCRNPKNCFSYIFWFYNFGIFIYLRGFFSITFKSNN